MEAYPESYVAHNYPLVLVSGLGPDPQSPTDIGEQSRTLLREGGFRVTSDLPLLTHDLAIELLRTLLAADSGTKPWHARSQTSTNGEPKLRIRRVGRTYTFPPRKAPPPAHAPRLSPSENHSAPLPLVLHSTISPLTPSSPLFPDGIITPLWITKHQDRLPAAFVSFLPLTTDPNTSSLGDNRLKNDINTIKSVLAATHYKSRLLVVLLCQDGEETPYDLEERIPSIRRATGLDTKSLLFLGPQATPLQMREFAHTLLSNIQPVAIEYYRDLSKHARRKRNRGSVPAPTGPPVASTSQVLSTQGWNVRYELKMGIFAEFRQEMDAAGRNYDSAYETLVGPELLDSVSLRSPRFNEMRMLADVIVIRIIRCLLWSGSSSAAVRSWLNHRSRMRELVDRQANGTKVYGWEAWEATWARLMAQLIEKAQVPALRDPESLEILLRKASGIFAYPENSKAGTLSERVIPWELLHHEGYWMKNSARHQLARRSLAYQIPEEDRDSPTRKSPLYDTYLAEEPSVEYPEDGKNSFDHSAAILAAWHSSVTHFTTRQQNRAVEEIGLQMANEYMVKGSWTEALCVLRPMWTQLSWRQEGWWQLVEQVGWQLRECAFHCRDTETIIRVDWELYCNAYVFRRGWTYDFGDCLHGLEISDPKPAVVLRAEDCVSCIEPNFQFGSTEGNVGEPLKAQLTLSSLAQLKSAPIRVSEIKIVFEGSLRSIRLISDESMGGTDDSKSSIKELHLREFSELLTEASDLLSPTGGLTSLTAMANLTMHSGQVRTWNLICIPREAGDARIASITLLVNEEGFSLAYVVSANPGPGAIPWWEIRDGCPQSRHRGIGDDFGVAKILPKPPKVGIELPGLRNVYYIDETVSLPIKLSNSEGEPVIVSLDIRLVGLEHNSACITWRGESEDDIDAGGGSNYLSSQALGQLSDQESRIYYILVTNTVVPFDYELEVSAKYHLLSDPDTPIHKTRTIDLPFIRPFEANSDIAPRLDPEPWPDFFSLSDEPNSSGHPTKYPHESHGIRQQVALLTRLVSFAVEPLILQRVDVIVLQLSGNADCHTISQRVLSSSSVPPDDHEKSQELIYIAPEQLHSIEHTLAVHKQRLGDREPVHLDLALSIRWYRKNANTDESPTTTILPIRRHNLNISEPRVLVTRSPLAPTATSQSPTFASSSIPTAHLTYTVENPSLHFLTFTLTMETSDTFAFSGTKHLAVSLTPLSRYSVEYQLLGTRRTDSVEKRRGKKGAEEDDEGWWVRPNLVVHDTHFKKTLRVLPAGEGVAWVKGGGGVRVRIE